MWKMCLNKVWGWISDRDGGYSANYYLGLDNFFWGVSPLGDRNNCRLYIFYLSYQTGGHEHNFDAFILDEGGVQILELCYWIVIDSAGFPLKMIFFLVLINIFICIILHGTEQSHQENILKMHLLILCI